MSDPEHAYRKRVLLPRHVAGVGHRVEGETLICRRFWAALAGGGGGAHAPDAGANLLVGDGDRADLRDAAAVDGPQIVANVNAILTALEVMAGAALIGVQADGGRTGRLQK